MPVADSSSRIRSIPFLLLAVFLAACSSSGPPPESGRRANDPVSTAGAEEAWREHSAQLPPYPQPENLIEFTIVGATSFTYFADLTTVSVDPDRVVRYAVIARSRSGSENATFEGIHCESKVYKVYAYGSVDKTWRPQQDPQWQPLEGTGNNAYRGSLYRYYLCPNGLPQRNTQTAIKALKRGKPKFEDFNRF